MGYSAYQINLKGLATTSAAGNGSTIKTGSLVDGILIIHITTMSGTQPRLYPSWHASPNATATGGRFVAIAGVSTAIKATGLSQFRVGFPGSHGRLAWLQGGTSSQIRWAAWLIGQGA
jgi:hypothetical protein